MRRKIILLGASTLAAMTLSGAFASTALAATRPPVYYQANPDSAVQPPAKAGSAGFIGKKAARRIALRDAGCKKRNCSGISIALRGRAGKKVYQVNFTFKRKLRYHYTLNASNGSIVSYYTKVV